MSMNKRQMLEMKLGKLIKEIIVQERKKLNESIDDTPIKVLVSKKYSHDLAERLIDHLESIGIGSDFIDSTPQGVILNVYPFTDYDGSREDFEEYISNSEYFD